MKKRKENEKKMKRKGNLNIFTFLKSLQALIFCPPFLLFTQFLGLFFLLLGLSWSFLSSFPNFLDFSFFSLVFITFFFLVSILSVNKTSLKPEEVTIGLSLEATWGGK